MRPQRKTRDEQSMRFCYVYVTNDKKTSPVFDVEANNLGHALQKLAAMLFEEASVQVWRVSNDPIRTASVHRIGKAKSKPTRRTRGE